MERHILLRIMLAEIKSWQAWPEMTTSLKQAYELSTYAYKINPLSSKHLRQLLYFEQEYLRSLSDLQEKNQLVNLYGQHLQLLEKYQPHDIENLKSLASGWMRYASLTHSSYQLALTWGQQLVTLDPTSPGSWDTLGVIYLDKKEYDTALKTFYYIINTLKPDYPFAYFHLGETYRQMGQPGKAIENYEKALALGYEGAEREIEETKQMLENHIDF